MSDVTRQVPFLRRILLKTKPMPYSIWMAALATIVTSPMLLLGWAANVTIPLRTMVILQLDLSCLGFLMGLFASKWMRLPWLATFGDVLDASSRPVAIDLRRKLFIMAAWLLSLLLLVLLTWLGLFSV